MTNKIFKYILFLILVPPLTLLLTAYLSSNVDSSALIGPMCYVVGEVKEFDAADIDLEIISIKTEGQRGCPVQQGETYRVSYMVVNDQENSIEINERYLVGIEAFSSLLPTGESGSRLQWSDTTYEDGTVSNIVLNQSDTNPLVFETESEDENGQLDNLDTEETEIDEYTRKSSNMYFDLTLERRPQTPFGNFVPYILTVTSHIDSPRTQILWNMPTTLEARPRHNEFVSLKKDQTYTFRGRVRPLRDGTYDFSVSTISWQHDTNYTNSISDTVTFDRNLVLQPVSSHYQILNILKFVAIAIVFIGICILSVIVVKKYTKKAKDWLTPPT